MSSCRATNANPCACGPFVCPGCQAIAEKCAPWCPDDALRRKREDPGDRDNDAADHGHDECGVPF